MADYIITADNNYEDMSQEFELFRASQGQIVGHDAVVLVPAVNNNIVIQIDVAGPTNSYDSLCNQNIGLRVFSRTLNSIRNKYDYLNRKYVFNKSLADIWNTSKLVYVAYLSRNDGQYNLLFNNCKDFADMLIIALNRPSAWLEGTYGETFNILNYRLEQPPNKNYNQHSWTLRIE